MCGSAKWAARARAIVPLPLAAGPSTAMTMDLGLRIMPARFDRGSGLWQGAARVLPGPFRPVRRSRLLIGELSMVKPEWGAKRTCPKCATRFYDLGKDDPVTCIECG